MGIVRSWVGMLRRVDPRNILIVGFVGSLLSTYFLSLLSFPKAKLLGPFEESCMFDEFEVFRHSGILDKGVFWLGHTK